MKRPIRTGAQAIRDAVLLAGALLLLVSVRFERAGEGLIPEAQAAGGDARPGVVAVPAIAPDLPAVEPCPLVGHLELRQGEPGQAYRVVVSRVLRREVRRAASPDLSS
jgi:hypothetical protein